MAVTETTSIVLLPIDLIERDGETQPRVKIHPATVVEYAQDMQAGAAFPPITVFNDGGIYWLADGYHRIESALSIGATQILSNVKLGSKRDAILYAVRANGTHGLRRSNEDKRRSVAILLQDPQWSRWSDRQIARCCGVHHDLVGKLRSSLAVTASEKIYKTKHGTTSVMDTTNIGGRASKSATIGNRVTVTQNHPLLAGMSGTICQVPNPGAAIVELDSGERELIDIQYLKPAIAHHLKLNPGGLVEVRNPANPSLDSRQGRIAAIRNETVEVWLRDIERMTMHRHRLPIEQVEPLPIESEPRLAEISDRLQRLMAIGLDPFELEIVSMLERAVVLTPTEMDYLNLIEKRYTAQIEGDSLQ
ncbi:ParB N-terminal domain-containing protein [Merismopedia glauca]|uniref:ParB/Sulfiredoxin domain-containing protein n=1 Tax=Merismopedia glauca CCAP 1448/3 TaxID=1296344 RepID=A0A2T1C9Z9_9CYAN|nr:ParB N-terminal domain-containing protein [Merismopedia glauca]PSB04977.1 hypothetical protein C7B64_01780 [Merismopedia glauca CCAP 1448/3]